jgi:glycosyltransferase involved in cell wall biosynthesis
MRILISVIIPTYHPGEYLMECFSSIGKQTLEKEFFEILVVLNGDIKDYIPLINKWKEQYLNGFSFKLLTSSIAGVSHARNIGISQSLGKYLCFVDDDDILSPNYLFDLLSKISENCIVVSNVLTFSDAINECEPDYISEAFLNQKVRGLFLQRTFLSSACCKIIPKAIIDKRRFNETITIGEDSVFMFSISDKIKQIIFSESDSIYYRRIRPDSASRIKVGPKKRLKDLALLLTAYSRIYFSNPLKYNFFVFASRLFAAFHNLKN